MDTLKKKAEIELAISNVDEECKVVTETIANIIHAHYERDKQIIFYPEDYNDEEDYDDEYLEKYNYFMGYDILSFSSYQSENEGAIFHIKRSILPNSNPTDEHIILIELIFDSITFINDRYNSLTEEDNFLTKLNIDTNYNTIKGLVPDQVKITRRIDNVN